MKNLTGLLCCFLLAGQGYSANYTVEERLIRYLEPKLHPLVRPMNSSEETVRVRMYLMVMDYRMDDLTETFETYAWVAFAWRNPTLRWAKEDFPGLWYIQMPADKIWHPSVELLNRRTDNGVHNQRVFISRSGRIWYTPKARFTVPCSMDLSYFPFDTQTCYMNFSSTQYNEKQVKVMPSRYIYRWYRSGSNGNHWKMTSSKVTRYLVDSLLQTEKDAGLKYDLACMEFVIQRISAYYTFVYVGPAVILGLLTAVIFLLPPADPQKATLGGVLLVGYTLIFIELGTILPTFHSNVPLLDKYYMAMYVMLALSVVFTAVLINLTGRSEGACQPPELLRTIIIDYMGKCLCMPYNPVEYGRKVEAGISNVNLEGGSAATTPPTTTTTTATTTPTSKQEEAISDWLHMSAILDRLLLFVYIVVTIIITATILKGHP